MTKLDAENADERVLILAPTGRDASLTNRYLSEAGVQGVTCSEIEELCRNLSQGAGAALISEEALTQEAMRCLVETLDEQPPWSDFPLIVLTSGGEDAPGNLSTLKLLGEASSMTLVERPTRVITLISAVRSALRARRRQYEVRTHLEAERKARDERTRLLDEAVEAREQAEASNRAKDIFLATLSHELRTPLTAVLGWARMLRSRKIDEATAEHGLQVIERNAESQNQMIQELLDVSRIVTGKLQLEVELMQLMPVIKAAVDSVQHAVEAKSIELDVNFETESALVTGDPERLQQVIWNLLSNAIKFTPKAGHIEVKLERYGSDVRIKVSDTGMGISPDFLPHVFERFRQADGSTTRAQGGLGLGLAVVRHIIEQHGGTVAAESEGEDRGSTFTVNLPVAAASTRAKKSQTADEQADAGGRDEQAIPLDGLRVLIVDDQPDARELLSMILNDAGAEVLTADSAAAAFELIGRAKPDVLVSDIGMPHEDGFSLISRIRSLPSAGSGKIPAISLTAYASLEDRQRSRDAGFDEHVVKPVEPSELIVVVARLAGRDGDSK